MALEELVGRIMKEAESRAGALRKEAEAFREKAFKEAEQEAGSGRERILSEASQEAKEERKRITSSAELDGRKALLSSKRSILDEAFGRAEERVLALDDASYCDLIKRMILASAPKGDEEVIISKHDEGRITKRFLAGVNEELIKRGKQGNLKLRISLDEEPVGGFILKGKEIEVDSSLGSLLAAIRDELQSEVAKVLFEKKPAIN